MKNPVEGFTTLQFLLFVLLLIIGITYSIRMWLRRQKEAFEAIPRIKPLDLSIKTPDIKLPDIKFKIVDSEIKIPLPGIPGLNIPISKPDKKDDIINKAINGFNSAIIDPLDHAINRVIMFASNVKRSFEEIGDGFKEEWNIVKLITDCAFAKSISLFPCLLFYIINLCYLIVKGIIYDFFLYWLLYKKCKLQDFRPMVTGICDMMKGFLNPILVGILGFGIGEWPPLIDAVCFKCTPKPTVDAIYLNHCVVEGSLLGTMDCYMNRNIDGSTVVPQSRVNSRITFRKAWDIMLNNNPSEHAKEGIEKIGGGFKRFASAWDSLNPTKGSYHASDVDEAVKYLGLR